MNAKEKGVIDLMNTQQIQKISRRDLYTVFDKISYEAKKEVFDIFDKYACIKNDKWYLELKEKELEEKN